MIGDWLMMIGGLQVTEPAGWHQQGRLFQGAPGRPSSFRWPARMVLAMYRLVACG